MDKDTVEKIDARFDRPAWIVSQACGTLADGAVLWWFTHLDWSESARGRSWVDWLQCGFLCFIIYYMVRTLVYGLLMLFVYAAAWLAGRRKVT